MRTQFNVAGGSLGGLTTVGYVPVTLISTRFLDSPRSTLATALLTQRYDASGAQMTSSELTFCVDIANWLDQGMNTGNVSTITANPDSRNLLAAGWVMNQVVGAGTIGSYLTGTSGVVSQAAKTAAAQLAIWEVAFDARPGDVATGDFTATGTGADYANAVRIADNIVADCINRGAPGSAAGLIEFAPWATGSTGLTGRVSQDQIFYNPGGVQVAAVPEPSTMALAFSGLGVGWLLCRRRRVA